MRFKFNGTFVEINNDGKVICDNIVVKDVLTSLVLHAVGNPEDGYPAINAITDAFGRDSITDIAYDENSEMVY
jgi:hypothetical protein